MTTQPKALSRNRGFTLIELMIVVAVIGILGAIAYPSYTESVLKGRRAQGRTALMELLQQQERFMTQRNCYMGFSNTNGTTTAVANTTCGVTTSDSVPFKAYSGDNADAPAYRLSATTCTSNLTLSECVKLVAKPTQSDPKAGDLEITSSGIKTCTGTAGTSSNAADKRLCWP